MRALLVIEPGRPAEPRGADALGIDPDGLAAAARLPSVRDGGVRPC